MSPDMTLNTIVCVQWQSFMSGQDGGLAGSSCITGNVWANLKYSWSYPQVDVQGKKHLRLWPVTYLCSLILLDEHLNQHTHV